MNGLRVIILFVFAMVISGCARDNAVAMNLYDPSSGDYEVVSGASVEITQDMINKAKTRPIK